MLTNAYCTEEQLREQFDDDGSILPSNILERAINATSRSIDEHCHRRFWQDPTAVARTYSPEFRDRAWVDDISTTTGLIVQTGSGDGTFDTAWILGSDFRLEPRNASANGGAYAWTRIVALNGRQFTISDTLETLQVTARFGWSEIPPGVEQACILRAAAIFKRRESVSGVAGFDGFGVVRISTRMDPDVVELLRPFVPLLVA
jgi:hypothetical protein